MRTLVDLLSNDHGYARIYAAAGSYGYELYTYLPRPIADLFASMGGFSSMQAACEAAAHQLSAVHQVKRRRKAARSRAAVTASVPVNTILI